MEGEGRVVGNHVSWLRRPLPPPPHHGQREVTSAPGTWQQRPPAPGQSGHRPRGWESLAWAGLGLEPRLWGAPSSGLLRPPAGSRPHPRGLAGSLWQDGSPGPGVLEATCHRWRTGKKLPPGPQTPFGQELKPFLTPDDGFHHRIPPSTVPGWDRAPFTHQETLPCGWMRHQPLLVPPPRQIAPLEVKDQRSIRFQAELTARSTRAHLQLWPQPAPRHRPCSSAPTVHSRIPPQPGRGGPEGALGTALRGSRGVGPPGAATQGRALFQLVTSLMRHQRCAWCRAHTQLSLRVSEGGPKDLPYQVRAQVLEGR